MGKKILSDLTSPSLESELILQSVIEKSREYLHTHPSAKLLWWDSMKFFWRIYQRKRRIPLHYITGTKIWSGSTYRVSPSVLIPRDETEILCEHIIQSYKNKETPQNILDIGTGSGCIAIKMAQNFPESSITAIDTQRNALKIAKINAQTILGKNKKNPIQFKKSSLLKIFAKNKHSDLIIANLPYIPKSMKLEPELSHEPKNALFGGKDGLEIIRTLEQEIREKNMSFSCLWLEFLPTQSAGIKKIFSTRMYQTSFYKDLGGSIFFAKILQEKIPSLK